MLDVKMRDFNEWPGIARTMGKAPPRPDDNQRVQVWQPLTLIPQEIENWLYSIWHDPPAILMVDEASALNYGGRDVSEEYNRITKLGRALPVLTIAHSQEVVQLPRNMIGQADHVIRFRIKHPYDRRIVANLMEMEKDELPEPEHPHGFHYLRTDGGEPNYFEDAQHFFGLR